MPAPGLLSRSVLSTRACPINRISAEQREHLCAFFEAQWGDRKNRQTVEEFISGLGFELVDHEIAQLIDLEIELRAGSGESFDVFEYRNRFPHYSVAIESAFSRLRAFDELVTRTDALIGSAIPGGHSEDFETGRPETIPERLGDFEIGRKLGSGAFGIVHLAVDTTTGQELALKFPRRQRIQNRDELESFRKEAEAAQELKHRGIVSTYGVYEINGYIFIAQQYIAGGSLGDIKKNSFSQQKVAELVAAVADALAYAHQQGITHRDLKPSNIMLDADGNPLIVDFGLAVHESAQRRLRGQRCGTPAYMSPEQVNGLAHLLDGRSDIWSIGVIMYELLVNRRPFSGNYREELFEEITERDPKPPRMIRPQVDRELQRICLKCMCKAIRERYHTADELAHDLQSWLAGSSSRTHGGADRLRIVPQGLRSFGVHDADFFQRLLPGPKDQNGLSESTRFWKSKIDPDNGGQGFRVGVIIGPSGCGKSSYVKAGLLPHLAHGIDTIFVEATSKDTEARLLQRLRTRFPALPQDVQLSQLVDLARDELRCADDKKLLIVIDQFEQWLHSHQTYEKTELLQALQHSDGINLQCILLLRDDFWLRMSQFLYAMEIDFREGTNARRIDLFDLRHARQVLHEFGLAYHKLPELDEVLSPEQDAFLRQAVESIAEDNRVVCVRLALFAEMFRDRPWTVAELEKVGGAAGIGETFLNETFASPDSEIFFRRNEQPVRRVLGGLLPPSGENIRAHMRTHSYLLDQSRLSREKFDQLMNRLDQDLRLVTPTDPNATGENEDIDVEARHFQLTHDYLVPSIRDWLTGEQQRTKRGRAELRLKELSEYWGQKEDSNFLPGWLEYLSIRFRTSSGSWTALQSRFMNAASRIYLLRGLLVLCGLLIIATTGWFVARRTQADSLINQLSVSQIGEVPEIAGQMVALREWIEPRLSAETASLDAMLKEDRLSETEAFERLRLKLGLVHLTGADADPNHIEDLFDSLVEVAPDHFEVVRDSLHPHCQPMIGELWKQVEAEENRLPAAAALALYDPDSEQWTAACAEIADSLVNVPVTHVGIWLRMFEPVDEALLPALTAIHADMQRRDGERSIALEFIAEYQADSSNYLVEAIEHSDPAGFQKIIAALRGRPDISSILAERFARPDLPDWNDEHEGIDVDQAVADTFEAAGGEITASFAYCIKLPRERFRPVCEKLKPHGFRPASFRAVPGSNGSFYSVVWTRDGREYSTQTGNEREIKAHHDEMVLNGMQAADLGAFTDSNGNAVYTATWCRTDEIETYLAIGLTEPLLMEIAGSIAVTGYRRLERRCSCEQDGEVLHAGIWSKSETGTEHFEIPASQDPAFAGQLQLDLSAESAEVWDRNSTKMTSRIIQETDAAAHRARAQELAELGFRPHLIQCSSESGGSGSTVSIWHRPLTPENEKDLASLRRVKLTMAMFALGINLESAWNELESGSDTRTRSQLIHRLREFGFKPAFLIDRLRTESSASIRQALLLALGEFEPSEFEPVQLRDLKETAFAEFRTNPDPGVHGAAQWLLKQLGEIERLNDLKESLECDEGEQLAIESDSIRRWYISPSGNDMVIIKGGRFLFGCQPDDPEIGEDETLQWKLVDRTFAISAHELTRRRYLLFQQETGVFDAASRDEIRLEAPDFDCPVTAINFYEAAQYCNWLSELEGIPEDQWCYEPNADGEYASGMRAKPDYLSLVGYRLPTTAEWEFACRGGTRTSRHFGQSQELLSEYAWFQNNSNRRTWPVASLKPNDFGLFDMLGNYWELCQGVFVDESFIDDADSAPLIIRDDSGSDSRALRGGGFRDPGYEVRIANKMVRPPFDRDTSTTFRVARTIPDP